MPPAHTYSRRAVLKLAAAAALTPLLRPVPAMATEQTEIELVFPQDPLTTDFVDSYGFARSGGRRHKGNDLMAPKMTPVYAAAGGVISAIGEGGTAGRRVTIDHPHGWQTWYLHLNNDSPGTDDGRAPWADTVAEGLEVGRLVQAGEQIGWVGDSGNAEWVGPHTHFELHRDGAAVDPYPYLDRAHRRALNKVGALAKAVRSIPAV